MAYSLVYGIPQLQKRCTKLKCVCRKRKRIGNHMLVVSEFLLLLAAPGLLASQSNSLGAPEKSHSASLAAPLKTDTRSTDDFADLTFTDDQKAKIAQIHQDARLRREAIVKNEILTQGQKDVTLERLQSIETSKIFKVLTPDQQLEVRKRITARRAAEQQVQKSKQAAPAPQ